MISHVYQNLKVQPVLTNEVLIGQDGPDTKQMKNDSKVIPLGRREV